MQKAGKGMDELAESKRLMSIPLFQRPKKAIEVPSSLPAVWGGSLRQAQIVFDLVGTTNNSEKTAQMCSGFRPPHPVTRFLLLYTPLNASESLLHRPCAPHHAEQMFNSGWRESRQSQTQASLSQLKFHFPNVTIHGSWETIRLENMVGSIAAFEHLPLKKCFIVNLFLNKIIPNGLLQFR